MTGRPAEGGGLVVTCPICRRATRWDEPPRGPFCSERCRLIDLGAWAEGRYTIPGAPVSDEETPPEPTDDDPSRSDRRG
ncbi:MAG TPA: DNA gyrase inhibitor YacG [Thermodesulfobacteriota bacterium]